MNNTILNKATFREGECPDCCARHIIIGPLASGKHPEEPGFCPPFISA